MRLREMTGRLRGRDMELGRVMEDKMRLLAEMLDEIGVEHNLAQVDFFPPRTWLKPIIE